ncbi:TfuA-like protein [Streptosporangium sp. NPDC000396]|uniref:TfuA-like protein n=1 Tax=Streptosporangium sp. NPDC000396 TaxID=3366185 RepID=UPI00369BF910
MAETYVFLGPSLRLAEAERLLPGATFLPPIRHGDLLRINPKAGDRVLIIDGLFMLTPPVRHREILDALQRGVHVSGSSSMGAMRAAELWPYGMRGIGTVFELFRDGVVTGDDEVAVVHAPAEADYASLSEPLVNLRITLTAAAGAGHLTQAEADTLLELGRSLPFRARGPKALEHLARAALADDSIDRYLAWHAAHPLDAKADDARLLLRLAATQAPELTRPNISLARIEHVETGTFERWRARHRGERVGDRWVPDASAVAAIMALHPDVPALHRRHVLALISGGYPATPDADLERRALGFARARGLLDDGDPDRIRASEWLAPSERHLAAEEAALRVLVRTMGTVVCAPLSERALPPALLDASVVAVARQFVRAALELTDRLPKPDAHRPHLRLGFRPDAVNAVFAALWDRPLAELPAAAWDRGFAGLAQLHRATEPFVAMLKVAGPPRFPF